MAAYRVLAFLLLLLPAGAFAQVNRYIVFFKDKNNTPYSIASPEQFLSSKSIERRNRQHIAITSDDLPVNPAYITDVGSTGARTFFSSRWMNCLLVEIGADSIHLLTALPEVSAVVRVAPGTRLLSGSGSRKFKKTHTGGDGALTSVQLSQLGMDVMHKQGFTGEGITLALLDAGFVGVNTATPFRHLFTKNKVKFTFDFVANSGNVYQYDPHGTEVLSTIAGDIPGTFDGGAPDCDFLLFVTEDVPTEYKIEEYNWLFAAERADALGADIIGTSLGYNLFDDPSMDYTYNQMNGTTAVITQAANHAIAAGIVVVSSAGNEGTSSWVYITPPSDGRLVLSVGAVDLEGRKASFSSFGPTADNRIKPDVAAMGVSTALISPSGVVTHGNGTSFASPLISGLVAGVLQASLSSNPNITVPQIYEAIIMSGDQTYAPDNMKGYGVPNFQGAMNYLHALTLEDPVEIYPNPAAATALNVAFKTPEGDQVTVTLYDRLGRLILRSEYIMNWQNNPLQMNMESLSPGVYIIHVSGTTVSKTFKWVKL